MRRCHLLHGFNVRDGGAATTDTLQPYFRLRGWDVVQHDYGWVGLIGLRFRNEDVVGRMLKVVKPGDVVVAHSNGCLITHQLAREGAQLGAVVCIQPALRRDCTWPESLPVLCVYNDKDWVVQLGRIWGRLSSALTPFKPHGWGAAGRYGFTAGQRNVENWNTNHGQFPVTGHSEIFQPLSRAYWGPRIAHWATEATRCQ